MKSSCKAKFKFMESTEKKDCNLINHITITNSNVRIGCCETLGNSNLNFDELPHNPKNAYDFTGEVHNFLLKECESYLEQNPCEIEDDLDCIVRKVTHFLKISGYNVDEYSLYEIIKAILDDANNYCVNYINKTKLSDESKEILIKTINELIVLSDKALFDYAKYKKIILKYENEIINSKIKYEKDRIILLSVFSILRYSLFYNLDKYNKQNTFKSTKMKGWLKGLIVGVCDVTGGILGGIGGSALGPAGTVTGITAGATATSTCADKILNQKDND